MATRHPSSSHTWWPLAAALLALAAVIGFVLHGWALAAVLAALTIPVAVFHGHHNARAADSAWRAARIPPPSTGTTLGAEEAARRAFALNRN